MMRLDIRGALRREFKGRAEAAALQRFYREQDEQRERRERKDDIEDDAAELIEATALIVSASEIEDFKIDLDRYDAATITALQHNEQKLARAKERWNDLLAKAHVLPDGRRVFKTEDGQQVFDEHGNELDPSIIDPDEISDSAPRWEEAEDALDAAQELEAERAELLAYQAKLDEARERLDSGEITQEEFDKMRENLIAAMPESVREQIPELAEEKDADAKATAAPTEQLDITDEMVAPSFAAKTLMPGMPG